MAHRIGGKIWMTTVVAVALSHAAQGQAPKGTAPLSSPAAGSPASIEQPDANRVKEELARLLEGYPPALRAALALDSNLLANQAYLAPYPALVTYLGAHPEIVRHPAFYVGEMSPLRRSERSRTEELVEGILIGLAALTVFSICIGMMAWLVRTIVDYRRWSRLAKVQTDAHTKLLDRFTSNEDLLRYMQSPAGAKFLESSPIRLDAGPRGGAAPLSRILWSVQAGVVLTVLGIGLSVVSGRTGGEGAQALTAFGILAVAIGIGLIGSALAAYVISRRTGLLESPAAASRVEVPGAEAFGERR